MALEKGWKSNCQNNSQLLFQSFDRECELFGMPHPRIILAPICINYIIFLVCEDFCFELNILSSFQSNFLVCIFCLNVLMCVIKENAKGFQIFCSVVHQKVYLDTLWYMLAKTMTNFYQKNSLKPILKIMVIFFGISI